MGTLVTLAFALSFVPGPGGSEALPDEKQDLKAAVHRLSEQSSYSWTLRCSNGGETSDRFAFGPCQGKRERNGLTWILTQEEPPIEAAIKGGKLAINSPEGWIAEHDLAAAEGRLRHPRTLSLVRTLKTHASPTSEADDLVKRAKDLKSSANGYFWCDLAPEDARDLIRRATRTGSSTPEISGPRGTLGFWVRDGILAKYEVHLEGSLTYATADKAWTVLRTATVEISGLGSTRIDLPEDARKKLEDPGGR